MRGARSSVDSSSGRLVSAAAKNATSSTLRPKTPTVSSESAPGFTPARAIVLKVGLKPTMPQYEAGRMCEPAVCVPKASGTMKSATAAAEPLDEPPGVREGSSGWRVSRGTKVANSAVTVLPMMVPPARRVSATGAESVRGRWPA